MSRLQYSFAVPKRPFTARRYLGLPVFGVFLVATTLVSAEPEAVVKSEWKSRDIAIDGRRDEWPALTDLGNGLAVGAANDATSAYLVIATGDARVRAALARGLVVWLDASNKKRSEFGVQWPPTVAADADDRAGLAPAALESIDLLGPGKARRLLDLTSESGFAAAAGTVGNTLVFELKCPLAPSPSQAHAIGTAAGRLVGLGLFTPESQGGRRPVDEGPGDPGPMGLGPIVGGPGSGVPLPNGPRPSKPQPPPTLKEWATLQLATK